MSAYNMVRIDFVDGNTQFRFYKNPISIKDYMHGEKGKIESDRIDKKIKNHVRTPFGDYADITDKDIEVLTPLEKELRHQRSVISSANRAISTVYSYARGNVWDWFITLTFDKEKIDRYNYSECSKKMRTWLNNLRKKYAPDLKYLIVPEEHKGSNSECKCLECDTVYRNNMNCCPECKSTNKVYAWHFHGLLSNTGLIKFNKAFNKNTGEVLITKSGLDKYNFGSYKLGFNEATQVTDTAKVSSYITKYITKELCIKTKGFRRFYPSANLEYPSKSFYLYEDKEKIEFLKENKKRITYNKEVRVKVGSFENTTNYIEIDWSKENV